MKKILFIFTFILSSLFLFGTVSVLAGPQSTTYELKEWGFGAGGTQGNTSPSYSMFGTVGEIDMGKSTSPSYGLNAGLVFTFQASVPPAPGFTNPGSNYDRLKFVLNNGSNPQDTTFAIAISDDDFATTRYIQSDNTIGTSLGSEDWQSYTDWGGATGEYVTGLARSTTYKIKVKAQQGIYTETPWGPVASASTVDPSLTFGIDSSTLTFNNLNSGNSYTDSSKSTVLTTSTNAYYGYIIYGRVTQPLTFSGSTIPHFGATNASPTTWTGTGFGYTTNDSSLAGGTADRFTNGGPNYAGFPASSPGDPVADHASPVLTAISNEQFTVSYRVTASATTNAGNYQTTVLYVVVPTY